MKLDCLNEIITSNLAINIDLTNSNSWNLNTGLTSLSLTKWSGAISGNINLIDFGLTAFDNGRTNIMWDNTTFIPQYNLFSMYRVGFNNVQNPITGETSGVTCVTEFLPISAITSNENGNYFELNGGYLQGFFKLNEYDYELLPTRYNNGITIETLLYLVPESQGIFYMMGARAEDKYNPYFSGETTTGDTTTGVATSLGNIVNAFEPSEVLNDGFSVPEENMYRTEYNETEPVNNIKNNVMAFEITNDKRIGYKYIDDNGLIVTNYSDRVISKTGFTMISVVYTPNNVFSDDISLNCGVRRLGKLIFYVNGRPIWIVRDFPEFYFRGFDNNKEKQIGVPFSISWGGGSFGLKNSWHYDYQTYIIYNDQNNEYISSKLIVEADPIPTDCYTPPTGDTYLAGLSLSADSVTFKDTDACDSEIENPVTVMRIEYTGTTGGTGTTTNKYFIKFNQPISVISNREYIAESLIYVNGMFDSDESNKIKILIYGDDVDIISDVEYAFPLTSTYLLEAGFFGLHTFPDEYQWSVDGVMYYGETGFPVTLENSQLVGFTSTETLVSDYAVTGEMSWLPIKTIFKAPDNTGQNHMNIGMLIETSGELNLNGLIFIKDFKYTGADILVQDERKNNLIIEQNFNSGFIGGIQKLRVYDKSFTSTEVLHNAVIEAKTNTNINVNKGGRLIYN